MPLESAVYISDLVATNPTGSDPKSTADDHLRLIKSAVKTTFPNVTGAVSATDVQLSYVTGVTSAIQTQINAKGAIAGQVWTGAHDCTGATVTVATQATSDNTTKAASTAFVNALVTATSFSSSLPTQATHADQIPTTDGATASWTPNLKATVIRFKDGTDASKLMAFDCSGITTATTRTLAVPNKNGTLAMTSDLALTLLATLTPTAAANLDFLSTFSAAYDSYLVMFEGIVPNVTDSLLLRLANTGTADSGSNYFAQGIENSASTGTTTSATSTPLSGSVLAAGKGAAGWFIVMNANDATGLKVVTAAVMSHSAATPAYLAKGTLNAYQGAAVTGARLFWNGGNNFTAAGKVRIYGYN